MNDPKENWLGKLSNSLPFSSNVWPGYLRSTDRRWESGGCYLRWGEENSPDEMP